MAGNEFCKVKKPLQDSRCSVSFLKFHRNQVFIYHIISASPASGHRVLFSHCPAPDSFYLQAGWVLPPHPSCVCPHCTVCLPSGSAACSPNPTLLAHRLPAVHQELPFATHSIRAAHPLSCNATCSIAHCTLPSPTPGPACTLSIPKASYNLCHTQCCIRAYSGQVLHLAWGLPGKDKVLSSFVKSKYLHKNSLRGPSTTPFIPFSHYLLYARMFSSRVVQSSAPAAK